MAILKHIETTSALIDSINVISGQILHCTDSSSSYYDNIHNMRVQINDVIYFNDADRIILLAPSSSAIYITLDSNFIWVYDIKIGWKLVTDSLQITSLLTPVTELQITTLTTGNLAYAPRTLTKAIYDSNGNTLDNVIAGLNGIMPTITYNFPSVAGWYRIAASSINIGNNGGIFLITWNGNCSGKVIFSADNINGVDSSAVFTELDYSTANPNLGIVKARTVYTNSNAGNLAFLELYTTGVFAFTVIVTSIALNGWNTIYDKLVLGSIPNGYKSSIEYVFGKGGTSSVSRSALNIEKKIANFGGNSQTVTIPHGLGISPSVVFITPCEASNGSCGDYWSTWDSLNIYVTNTGNWTGKFSWLAVCPNIVTGLDMDLVGIQTQMNNITTYATAGGTGNALTLGNIFLNDGYNRTFIASADNNGAATTVNGIPLYKPNTTSPPILNAGQAYNVWYNLANQCFYLQQSSMAVNLFSQLTDPGVLAQPNDIWFDLTNKLIKFRVGTAWVTFDYSYAAQ